MKIALRGIGQDQIPQNLTSSSAIAKGPRCRVGYSFG